MFAKLLLAAIALRALLVCADPTPSIPGPGDSYKEGGECVIEWAADPTGECTNMQIELKTGNNWAMTPLKVITTIDGTKETRYVYECPKVSPHSAIYFYEFTCPPSNGTTWTTRFTITDADGNSTPPPEDTQPNGDAIPWGTGTLIDGSNSSPDLPSDSSSLPPSSPSGLPASSGGSSSSRILSSSSRLSSTRTPVPTSTGVNSGSSQSSSNGGMAVVLSKGLAFAIGLVTVSAALFL